MSIGVPSRIYIKCLVGCKVTKYTHRIYGANGKLEIVSQRTYTLLHIHITILHKVTHLLTTNPYVVVIALDFSKAFDTVRHFTLLEKLAKLDIPDSVYNWLVSFFSERTHCTEYCGVKSPPHEITASIIQGSGIGPVAYVVNAADLETVTPGNAMCKYADDTYLIVPAENVNSRSAEIDNVEEWSRANNLRLNRTKTYEIVFTDNRRKRVSQPPPPIPGIARTSTLKILGVTITSGLSMSEHQRNVTTSCAQTLYALKVLRAHGMCDTALQTIYRSVVIAKLRYASSAWWGFASATDRQRINAFLRRGQRSGFCPADVTTFEELCESADHQLLNSILANPNHLLYELLPPISPSLQHYNLRERSHNRQLPDKSTHIMDSNFIYRILYRNTY